MMFDVKADAAKKLKDGVIALPLFAKEEGKIPKLDGIQKDMDKLAGGAIVAAYEDGAFGGAAGEAYVLRAGKVRLLLIGLGEQKKADLEALRKAAASATQRAKKMELERYVTLLHALPLPAPEKEKDGTAPIAEERAEAVAFGSLLGAYKFDRYFTKAHKDDGSGKKKEPEKEVEAVVFDVDPTGDIDAVKRGVERGFVIGEATAACRDLANTPGNVATPKWMADQARRIARESGLRVQVLGPAEIQRHKMGGLIGVSKGSIEPPQVVLLEYRPKKVAAKPYKKVALVGKGITFDSGGISIKPGQSMDEMKFDKCGACAVFTTMQAVARLKPPVHVIGVAAMTENMPSGSAYKPGDILRMASGKTVEVLNTDAEGRLILGDALWFAQRQKPDVVLDFATLTGAIDVALGKAYTGLMSNDDGLVERLVANVRKSGEKVWRMPVGDEYQEMIKGTYADIKNLGAKGGGACTAAQFLKNFIEDGVHWAHFDIASTAWGDGDGPYTPKGATGVGIRTSIAFLDSLVE